MGLATLSTTSRSVSSCLSPCLELIARAAASGLSYAGGCGGTFQPITAGAVIYSRCVNFSSLAMFLVVHLHVYRSASDFVSVVPWRLTCPSAVNSRIIASVSLSMLMSEDSLAALGTLLGLQQSQDLPQLPHLLVLPLCRLCKNLLCLCHGKKHVCQPASPTSFSVSVVWFNCLLSSAW